MSSRFYVNNNTRIVFREIYQIVLDEFTDSFRAAMIFAELYSDALKLVDKTSHSIL